MTTWIGGTLSQPGWRRKDFLPIIGRDLEGVFQEGNLSDKEYEEDIVSNRSDKLQVLNYQLLEEDDAVISQETYDVLVLDARLRQSLATVRSLGSRGLRVAALGSSAKLPA